VTLEPLLLAPRAIWLHLAAALSAFFIGAWLLLASEKGSRTHRVAGSLYLALMVVAAVSAMWIHTLNPNGPLGLSPVHILVVTTLWGTIAGWRAARRHDVARHRRAMMSLYVSAMLLAGAFTLVPGRLLYRMLLAP
jgi:uncharacterized membrane protein